MAPAVVAGRDAGLSTRQYGPVVRRFAEAYGIEKSVVSEQFIEASRGKLRELLGIQAPVV